MTVTRSPAMQAIYDDPETRAEVCQLLAQAWIMGYDACVDLFEEAEALDNMADDFGMPKAETLTAENPFSDDPDIQGRLTLIDEA